MSWKNSFVNIAVRQKNEPDCGLAYYFYAVRILLETKEAVSKYEYYFILRQPLWVRLPL